MILVVNKVDTNDRIIDATEFYRLGLGDYFALSSINGSGTGEMLDEVVRKLPPGFEDELEEIPRYAIVGRPNVGKSTLINSLLGEERNIVTPVAGTTRDSIYTKYNKFKQNFFLVDTAGLRKRAKVHEDLEFYSNLRSVRAIENSDVCLMLLDATRGIASQDLNIMSLILKNNKGLVMLVNKWDLIEKDNNSVKLFEAEIRERIAPFDDVPIIFTSAITKQRLQKVLDTAMEVHVNRQKKIPTSELNKVMLEAIERFRPPAIKGKYIKIKYITQLRSYAPAFVFFCNLPQYIKEPYRRYLENQLRKTYPFTGVPIQIFFRKK